MVTFGSHGCWCACVSPEHDLIRKSKWVIVQLEVTNWMLPIIKGYEIAWGWNELINFLFLLYIPPYVEHEQEETFNYGIERNKLLDTQRYCSFQGTKYSLISILARAKSCYNPYGSYFQRTEKGGEWVKIWENGIDTCKISCMKWVASPGLTHDTGCLGLVHWDDPEGWNGEGGGRRVQDGEHMYTCGGFI